MKIYFATLPNGFFGSTGQSWRSLDVERVCSYLDYDTEIITISDLMNIDFEDTDIVVYTSSDEYNIRMYLKDVMYFIDKKCQILPSYNMLMSHENKGFQELLRESHCFGDIRGHYFFDIDDAYLSLPKVLKTVSGAGSSGVTLIKRSGDIKKIRRNYFDVSVKRKAIKLQRRIKLKNSEFLVYNYRHKGFNRFVEQDFIPDLTNDYKVLVFGNRYYCLKRNIKKGDFRASGSKFIEHVIPPTEVLEYAKDIFEKIRNPYASLDIAQSDHGCHLIEFQGTNFSPGTLLRSSHVSIFTDNGWVVEDSNQDLEENFAHAIDYFISYYVLSLDMFKFSEIVCSS